jgi:hypothetical protein
MLIAKFLILAMFDIIFITFMKIISVTLMQILIIVKIFFKICSSDYIVRSFFLSAQRLYCNSYLSLPVHGSEYGHLYGNCKITLLFISDGTYSK